VSVDSIWRPVGVVASLALLASGWTTSVGAAPTAGGAAQARGDLELQLILEVNRARAGRGLGPLLADGALGEVARERSWEIVNSGRFSHYGADGSLRFVALLDQHGIPFDAAGENLDWNTAADADGPRVAVDVWANSPAHAANLFGAQFSMAGLGVVSVDGRTYYTLIVKG
jgi:uncharacterized protein YkwD